MEIVKGKEEEFRKYIERNDARDSKIALKFLTKWANLMEKKLKKGKKLGNIAKGTRDKADKGMKITGFMNSVKFQKYVYCLNSDAGFLYGASISILCHFWVHGNSLKRWHKADLLVDNKGRRKKKQKHSDLDFR